MACSAKSLYQGLGKDEVDLRDIAWQIRESEVVSQLMELSDQELIQILVSGVTLSEQAKNAYQNRDRSAKRVRTEYDLKDIMKPYGKLDQMDKMEQKGIKIAIGWCEAAKNRIWNAATG